jgi:HPr kinase/phosphorylase
MGVGRRPGRLRTPLRRSGGARRALRRRPGRLPELHPPLPRADPGRARGRLPDQRHPEDCARRISRIVTLEPPVLVWPTARCARRAAVDVRARADPDVRHAESAAFVIDVLRAYLSKHFAERTSMHGVFMDILGLGVMITGESGLGKSELGLELISRGNGLVADDAVDLYRINQTTIEGRCPELLQNLLEVRGIGLLDIKAIFGETAVRRKMRLKLIVHLVRRETMERDYERMPYEPLTQDVLGMPVRKVVIPVVAGRNIAVLVEAAVRNTILQLRGIDTYQEFVERHRRAMEQDDGKRAGDQGALRLRRYGVTRLRSSATSDRSLRFLQRLLLCQFACRPYSAAWRAGCLTGAPLQARYSWLRWQPISKPWIWRRRAGAFRSRRRRTPRPCRSPGTPGGRGACLRSARRRPCRSRNGCAQDAGLLELGQHAVDGGQADVGAVFQQHAEHVFRRHVALLALLEDLQDLQARQGGLQAGVLEFVDVAMGGSCARRLRAKCPGGPSRYNGRSYRYSPFPPCLPSPHAAFLLLACPGRRRVSSAPAAAAAPARRAARVRGHALQGRSGPGQLSSRRSRSRRCKPGMSASRSANARHAAGEQRVPRRPLGLRLHHPPPGRRAAAAPA